MISTSIANLIDNHNGLFTFGYTYEDEKLLNILLGDVFSKLNSKELISIYNPESYKDIENWTFSNKALVVDLKFKPQPKDFSERRLFSQKLQEFCSKNSNTAIILTIMNFDMEGIHTITPKEIIFASSCVWTLNNGILKNPKNRYEMDGKNYNLIAYLREKKINEILND
jgi:hypothetical protein